MVNLRFALRPCLAVAIVLCWIGLRHAAAEDIDAVLSRLQDGSGGKTPTVKNFSREWVQSLFDRGTPKIYTRDNSDDFKYIGMPIGGIGAGELYIGGDGRLWWWDIFNERAKPAPLENGAAYAHPPSESDPHDPTEHVLEQGFALRIKSGDQTSIMQLDKRGGADIAFSGQYPVATVTYSDKSSPVKVTLEAMSPFVPLELDKSTYPATVMQFTVTNSGNTPVDCTLAGWMENAASLVGRNSTAGVLRNHVEHDTGTATIVYDAAGPAQSPTVRPKIVFEDFEDDACRQRWTATGDAFNRIPAHVEHSNKMSGFKGKGLVDSYQAGSDVPTGTLTSKPFTIDRRYIWFLIGGGNDVRTEHIDLLVDGKVVRSATGDNTEVLKPGGWDVGDLQGKSATIQIVDDASGGWGHILIDQIEFSDTQLVKLEAMHDFGNLCLQMTGDGITAGANPAVEAGQLPQSAFAASEEKDQQISFGQHAPLLGSLTASFHLQPGASQKVSYIVSWYFPNPLDLGLKTDNRRNYVYRFASARDVGDTIRKNLDSLVAQTKLWRDTWYDSTLPYWFLDRTFLNTSILATSTSYLQADGRFYGYEGVYSCNGTCTHVWSYAQAIGRVFPEIERRLRNLNDLGIALDNSGEIHNRDEFGDQMCVDGQCGTILRTLRDHQMSADGSYLRLIYPRMTRALKYMMNVNDPDGTGILTGRQPNTLDGTWYGKVAWLSGYYQAALRAAAVMADDMGDANEATRLRGIADKGRAFMDEHLFNGEYYFQESDPAHLDAPGSYTGCEYGQVLGQSWAYQVGLGQIQHPDKVTSALNALWRYNVTTDVGPYRAKYTGGRWYAMAGDGGMIGCTFPRGGDEVVTNSKNWQQNYMNECMAGYEYAATSLMMWHGLADKALAHTKLVNDRYDGARRNPWNECECGSHYSRSMASYGLFTAACGYEYFGPHEYIAFAPKISPENFKAAFTAAQGWGSFSQKIDNATLSAEIALKYGHLKLRTIGLTLPADVSGGDVKVSLAGQSVVCTSHRDGAKLLITLSSDQDIPAGQAIAITVK